MRFPIALPICLLLATAPASSEILYARPDGDADSTPYGWADEVVAESVPLADAIKLAKTINGSRALEIRLLRRTDARETLYTVDLGSTQSALRWRGSANNKLTIRGQVDRSGERPRALTTVAGRRSLKQILCEPHGYDLCATAPEDVPSDRRKDLLDYLAGEIDPDQDARFSNDIPLRLDCFLIWDSAFVEISDLGLRDCWLAAVATYRSANTTLRDSVIEGSTYAFAAIGKKGAPETSHTFEVIGNVWRQSPATYRPASMPCNIRNDWTCPVSVWSDVPWGIVHHHFWSPLNGALFTAKDILGNVRIAANHVEDAYNGIRVRLSDVCLADPRCREKANAGFEIVGNTFVKIRDNAIEPEGRAAFWVIKHNTFINVYAAISTDGVSGHDVLVFGNIFALDDVPGAACRDEGWRGSRQFRLTLGGSGKWSKEGAEGDDARCSTHAQGTVIKLGADDDHPDAPLLERLFFFNNSLRTRSPLFRASPAPPITSYNNAVEFIGCGLDGPAACRQEPTSEPCKDKDFWTRDANALYARCFPLQSTGGGLIPHRIRFNAYNRVPEPELDEVDRDRLSTSVVFAAKGDSLDSKGAEEAFRTASNSPLANGGCVLAYADGDLRCVGAGGPVGAMLPGGERFDIYLPFRFPFVDVRR
jgi:hypothetical protein